jgi:2-aminoethylphosphonate transport system permease protein
VARSLFLALLSAAAAVVLGGILVWSLPAGRSAIPLAVALGIAALTLVLPGTLWGLGLLKVREGLSAPGGGGGLLDTPLVMVLAGSARAAAGVAAVLAWGALRLNPEMLEAARTAGLPPLRRLLVTVGLMRRWVAAALLLGVALALGEVGASVMICPPGWETLAVRVFAAMHNGHGQVTAALALVTTAGAALFGVLAAVAGRGGAERC